MFSIRDSDYEPNIDWIVDCDIDSLSFRIRDKITENGELNTLYDIRCFLDTTLKNYGKIIYAYERQHQLIAEYTHQRYINKWKDYAKIFKEEFNISDSLDIARNGIIWRLYDIVNLLNYKPFGDEDYPSSNIDHILLKQYCDEILTDEEKEILLVSTLNDRNVNYITWLSSFVQ